MNSLSKSDLTRPTWRGFALGAILTFSLAVIEPHVKLLLHTNGLCTDYVAAGAVVLLFVLVVPITVLGKLKIGLGLSRADLITVFVMLVIASAIPSHGLLAPLYPVITGVFYYATPENRWGELIHPYLPDWVAPSDSAAIKDFFEGSADGRVPWGVWIKPFFAWFSLVSAVFFVMICMMVILRRQWVERERLLFPLTRLPLEMVNEGKGGERTFFKTWPMWLGFFISFILVGMRGLNYYFHFVPVPTMVHRFSILRNTTTIMVALNFAILGFGYLLSLDVALSIWLFHLLMKIESGIFSIVGFSLSGHRELWGGSSLATTHQNGGAMIVLVLFGLWMARGHLRDVFRKAFTRTDQIDDSDELFSYRVAVLGMIGGLIFIGFWLSMAGMPYPVIPVVISAVFITFLGLTRIVAQAGVGFMCNGISPPVLATSVIGTSPFDTRGMVALGTLYTWAFEGRTSVMASAASAFKLADEVNMRKRSLLWPVVIAIAITLAASSWMIFGLAYRYGGINLRSNWFITMPNLAWGGSIAKKILNPITPEMVAERWGFIGIGASFMLFLMFMEMRFLWWPLHYIGFPIADIWMMNQIWFNVFLAWLFKLIILKYGGVRWYRKAMPLFLGLILGQICVAGVWMAVDSLTGAVGNFIPVGLD